MSEQLDAMVVSGVRGLVNILIYGDIVILHTGEHDVIDGDLLFSRIAEGRPTELTRTQARALAHLILRTIGDTE